jgi:hypothetical protein
MNSKHVKSNSLFAIKPQRASEQNWFGRYNYKKRILEFEKRSDQHGSGKDVETF